MPSISEIVVTKDLARASTSLFRLSSTGEGRKATIIFLTPGRDYEPYLSVELENVIISSYAVSRTGGSAKERPTESMSLNFTKIKHSTMAFDEGARQILPKLEVSGG